MPSPVLVRSSRSRPGRRGTRRGRDSGQRHVHPAGPPGPARASTHSSRYGTWPEWLPRETRTQPVRAEPAVVAGTPLAALEMPVRAGPHPDRAVGVHAREDGLPVVSVEARIVRRALEQVADPRQEPGALPELVRAREHRVRVGVVEPVRHVEPAAAPDDAGEGGGAQAARRSGGRRARGRRVRRRTRPGGSRASRRAAGARRPRRRGSARAPGPARRRARRRRRPGAARRGRSDRSRRMPCGAQGSRRTSVRRRRRSARTAHRGRGSRAQECDELDRGLPALARGCGRPSSPVSSGQSRTRSTGLMQSFAIRRASEGVTVWPGKRLSGWRNP